MASSTVLIVGTVKNGVLVPHIACADIAAEFEGQQIVVSVEQDETKAISDKMMASLHVYCRKLSSALNRAGYDQRGIMASIGRGAPIPTSETSIKSLWKTVIDMRRGKPSTKLSTNGEMCEDYVVFDNMMSSACKGVSIPWPSLEGQKAEAYNNEA
tara:strand:- start:349 stop:816 length:468 start_codon:yes stop_codon:yes gene_type:complete